jgi:D-serine deaminase-like pyridoxal phosphate-dependent protein
MAPDGITTARAALPFAPSGIVTPTVPPDIVTPAILLDFAIVDANIRRMQAHATAAGVDLRPHVKTHKSVKVGRQQVAAGSTGITAGTLGEVEVFAEAGFDDIFFAYPVFATRARAERLRAVREVARLRVGLDSPVAADALAAAFSGGAPLEVVIEVDCGAGRCGVPPAEAGALAAHARSRGLLPAGAYTYPGHGDRDAAAPAEASEDELAALATAANAMRAEGIEPVILSGGSTPTSSRSARAPLTELRPGEYVYNDLGKLRVGACEPADLAFFVAATVVSDAVAGQVIVDVGTKALGREGSDQRGYGTAPDVPGAVLTKLNEYHGYLAVPEDVARPRVGDILVIAPNHVCPVVNLFDEMVVHEAGRPVGRWPVDARGHLS